MTHLKVPILLWRRFSIFCSELLGIWKTKERLSSETPNYVRIRRVRLTIWQLGKLIRRNIRIWLLFWPRNHILNLKLDIPLKRQRICPNLFRIIWSKKGERACMMLAGTIVQGIFNFILENNFRWGHFFLNLLYKTWLVVKIVETNIYIDTLMMSTA